MKRALITGIGGQIGSYLAELLLKQGYEVHGLVRRSSNFNTSRIDHIFDRLHLHFGDLTDGSSLRSVLKACKPVEIYNLAAQSHVRVSFDVPEYTADVTGLGTLRLLEAIRDTCPEARFYQASSSEIFGDSPPPQNEQTAFRPRSPYAAAKLFGYWVTRNYREAYGLFACNGILFNVESPRRGPTFVTRKITRAAARIKCGLQNTVMLGNLTACRDWQYAGDAVRAIWEMLQMKDPSDYAVGTGEMHSVAEFASLAFSECGLDWRKHVLFDERYLRPTEVNALCADASKARRALGWRPTVGFADLVAMMVQADLRKAQMEEEAEDAYWSAQSAEVESRREPSVPLETLRKEEGW
jgi:GDPmannose 4,6-dehydratase